jgi:hypothetical protein
MPTASILPFLPPEVLADLDDLRRQLNGAGQGAAVSEAALGFLPTPLTDFADWLALVTPAAAAGELSESAQDRIGRAARPLVRHGTLTEADLAQLGGLSPPHTPLATRAQGLDRLWDLFNGRTPQQQASGKKPRRQERGRER